MVFVIIIALVLGVLCGGYLFSTQTVLFFEQCSQWILYALVFSVGISVGTNKDVFKLLKKLHFKILLIPAGIIAGSTIGGILCARLLGYTFGDALAISSGLGWYSLAGVLITNLCGVKIGTVAFLANLMREIFSFISVPFFAKYFNQYTAIAPCAATSEDTTLPLLQKYVSEEIVVVAVINGVICSIISPMLINFFCSVF